LAVVVLSSAILGVTALAGLLTLHQIRNTGSAINSTKAIFAADAGIECFLYKTQKLAVTQDCGEITPILLDNGATYSIKLLGDPLNPTGVRSLGRFSTTARSFELTFLP